MHKALGKRAARTVIVTAAVVNLFMALYLQWAAKAPTDVSYPLGEEFQAVLAPLWRITIASIVAEVVSELVDTEVYHWFVRRVTTRHQWARVAVSNAVSLPIDSALFVVLAFGALPGLQDHALTLPWDAVWDIFVVNITVKVARERGEPAPDLPHSRPRLVGGPGRRLTRQLAQASKAASRVWSKPSPANASASGSMISS